MHAHVLFLVLLAVVPLGLTGAQEQVYVEDGGKLILKPISDSNPLTSILWKIGPNLVAEWVEVLGSPDYYGQFAGRTTLNIVTGQLEINTVTSSDSGVYSVELNGKPQNETYIVKLISAQEQVYVEDGGKLILQPISDSNPLTSILWKIGPDIVAEWVEVLGSPDYYGQFAGRTTLNIVTGQLEINTVTSSDVGVYSVELNGKPQNETYIVKMIRKVSKPTVSLKPLTCSSDSDFCTLSCDGGIPEAEPITYRWKRDGGDWIQSVGNLMHISNDDKDVENFFCQMENPLGVEESEPEKNPFYQRAQEQVYIEDGGKLILQPISDSNPLTSILWKIGPNLVAEWVEVLGSPDYYGQFVGRTSLNIVTGQLEINTVTSSDVGVYSVELNGKPQNETYIVKMIKKVSKPTVSLKPLTCSSDSDSCTLSCDGGIPEAEPIIYRWRRDGGDWELSSKLMNISNDDKHVENFCCQMKNPLSVEESEPEKNPFYQA